MPMLSTTATLPHSPLLFLVHPPSLEVIVTPDYTVAPLKNVLLHLNPLGRACMSSLILAGISL